MYVFPHDRSCTCAKVRHVLLYYVLNIRTCTYEPLYIPQYLYSTIPMCDVMYRGLASQGNFPSFPPLKMHNLKAFELWLKLSNRRVIHNWREASFRLVVTISLSSLKAQKSPSEDFGCRTCDRDVMAAFLVNINAKKMGK